MILTIKICALGLKARFVLQNQTPFIYQFYQEDWSNTETDWL